MQEIDKKFNLSSREKECLAYLLKGKTAKETGRLLAISHRTVETYINHIKDKFGCSSYRQLFVKVAEMGYFN